MQPRHVSKSQATDLCRRLAGRTANASTPAGFGPDAEREHFEIERELADRLRVASREERRHLYGEVYSESRRRIAYHALVQHMVDEEARAGRVDPQIRLAQSFAQRDYTFLEIGAGNGEVAMGVAPHVKKSIAIDVTDALARPSEGNYEFVLFDGFTIPRESDSVDLAFSKDVVEHLHPDDAREHFREVHRVLRRGGRYVCVTPNRLTGPHDISRNYVTGAPEGFHLKEYTATELSQAMYDAGFARVYGALSFRGYRFSPLFPIGLVRRFERALGSRSLSARRRFQEPLAAIKVIGVA